MTALLAGELRRLLSRRMIRVLIVLAVAGIVVASVITFFNTGGASDATLRRRTADAETRVARCAQDSARSPDPILPPGGRSGLSLQNIREMCRFRVGKVTDDRFQLSNLKGILQGVTAPLVIVAWVIGASSIGAEWQARSLTTLLTWEPRRGRVLVAKVVAAMVVACAFSLVSWALLSAALLPSAILHGTTAGTGGGWLRSVGAVVLRGELMIAIATGVGFAVASIGRNTAAALGVGFAYFLVIENVVGNYLAGYRRWLILGNSIVLISGKDSGGDVAGRSVLVAGIYLSAVAVVLLAVAVMAFQRRDVA